MAPIAKLREHLASPNKRVRLKALKLVLAHEAATPLDIVKCLCSEDNRNFEFLEMFGLGSAMRTAWSRIKGTEDAEVYEFLDSLYASDPSRHAQHVVFILELLGTRRALTLLDRIAESAPPEVTSSIQHVRAIIGRN
jgi:hypothetical protein